MWVDAICSVSHDFNGLFPVVFNLASKAHISVNATCGATKPEVFCKLVEHVKIFPAENRHCGICDNSSSNPLQRHPITNAIDGSNRWWQSPTLTNGAQYNYVTITIDLKQIYQVAYIIIKAANAPRPGNWILEKSLDGVHYEPWQYFAMTDRECRDAYRKRATVGVPTTLGDNEVICTSRYSSLTPLENGEIFVSLVNNRPGVFQPSKELVDFVSARYVRLRFQKIRTLNADLMTFASIDPTIVDETVTRRRLQCHCQHNTDGDNCEKCLPLFNNKPWQVGGIQNLGCEECNCHGKADSCVYNATVDALGLALNMKGDIDGGGVCINCKEYTAGINCEKCIDGYYRPTGVSPYMRFPCKKCSCQETQTTTSKCVLDDSGIHIGLHPGDCLCQKGYAGRKCNTCETGYYGYPNCRPCRCNAAGSVSTGSCDRACSCKPNVYGNYCDKCLEGHFNLEHANPDGCMKCFCFGITDVCESVTWGLSRVETLKNWRLHTLVPDSITLTPKVSDGWLCANIYVPPVDVDNPAIFSQNDVYYWIAPPDYHGNRLSSYGGYLEFTVKYSIHDQQPWAYHVEEPNFILMGSNLTISSMKERLRENIEHVNRIRLHESSWYHLDSCIPVTKEEFMLVLYNLNEIMIRGTYHTAQDSISLKNVILDVASPTLVGGTPFKSVEQCRCPVGFSGSSCESCAPGYRRVNDILIGGMCRKCDCNNHTTTCHSVSGQCIGCRHNTMGQRCDRCLPGFYGDPRYGTPDDCRPCACPLVNGNNFFAEKCEARPTLLDRLAYECLNCRLGYTGSRCEICAPGYYGNPSVPGGSCRRCSCGGSFDPNFPGICNNITGKCYVCTNNTEGEYCEKCKAGFYGTAVNGDCSGLMLFFLKHVSVIIWVPTMCSVKHLMDSVHVKTDILAVDPGYGNIEKGCERCSCDRQGSQSLLCDPVSGQCTCRPGIGGLTCGQCERGYYDFSRSGCKRCNCHAPGTINDMDCDPNNGRCICKPGVSGLRCDKCEVNYYGLSSGQGCYPCNCSIVGSTDIACQHNTGQCSCKPGVGGRNCDRCLKNYYGFSSDGCQACEVCDKPGHICDQLTGKCVCPPYTEGPNCERCKVNCWGYDPYEGCKPQEPKKNGNKKKTNGRKDKNGKNGKNKNGNNNRKSICLKLCNCHVEGSSNEQCHALNGQCDCLPGYQGLTCDSCTLGHFENLTRCQPCGCHQPGALDRTCMPTYCECDGHGSCSCKKNVEGPRCDRCRNGTFNLNKDNPDGCTECFCFGRSLSCRQAPYSYTNIKLTDLDAEFVDDDVDGEPLLTKYGHLIINSSDATFVPPDKSDQPIYWQLPRLYPRDMVLSYNGKLKFIHLYEGPNFNTSVAIYAPLVILIGNGIHLHSKSSILESNHPMPHEITFNEFEWMLPNQNHHVSRRILMTVLQNVQDILVRATQDGTAVNADLAEIVINHAVPQDSSSSSDLALGVELCKCPEQYSGESCQNPGPGYHREIPDLNNTNFENIESIIGPVKPCACYLHSNKCEPETGKCKDCQHNTTGDYCDVCSDGFYGFATTGTIKDCKPCACPLPTPSNNFSPKCVVDRIGVVCTACAKGHVGRLCEICSPGYYGEPGQIGDKCKPCRCNPEGSRNEVCDSDGQCECLSGISGKLCDECSDPSYGVQNGLCVSCYEGCTGILLNDLQNITGRLPQFNFSDAVYPWNDLENIKRQVSDAQKKLSTIEKTGLEGLQNFKNDADRYMKMADNLLSRSTATGVEACKLKNRAAELLQNATQKENEANQEYESVNKTVDEVIEKLIYHGTVLNISTILRESQIMLKEIQKRNFIPADNAAKHEIMLAEKLSESILRFINSSEVNGTATANSLKDVIRKLRDLRDHVRNADNTISEAIKKIKDLQGIIKRLKELVSDITELHKHANNIIDRATSLIEDAEDDLMISKNQSDLLDTGIAELEYKVKELSLELNDLYKLVKKAHKHAEDLQQLAEDIDRLFSATRNLSGDAVRAANAYKDIIDAIRDANISAENAYKAAKEAKDISQVGVLLNKVRQLKETSDRQTNTLIDVQSKIFSLEDDQKIFENLINEANDLHDRNYENLERIKYEITSLPTDIRWQVNNIEEDNKNTEDTIRKALELLRKFNTTVLVNIKELNGTDFDGLDKEIEVDILLAGNITKNVNEVQSISQTLDHKVNTLIKKSADVGYSLNGLREKINNARSIVNRMKMSLLADGKCVRSYRSPLKPSSTNEISFGFNLTKTVSDMLLVLLQESPEEFLAMEIRDQKVKLSWNSGKGQGSVSHDEILKPGKWYRVEAKRIGSIGQLKVWNVENSSSLTTKQFNDSISAGCSLMNLNENSTIFLAGSNTQFRVPRGITPNNFTGCLGDIFLDQNKIGVYNFKTNVKDNCKACLEIPDKKISSPVYVFNGNGYARLISTGFYSTKQLRMELQFKTFWENSRIFFIGHETTGDFLSIELQEGRVAVRFALGNNTFGSGQTSKYYNNNIWTKLIFNRKELDAVLIVDTERIDIKAIGTSKDLNVNKDAIYYGGIPTNLITDKFKGLNHTEPFFGCMQNLNFANLAPEAGKKSLLDNVQISSGCRENGIHNVDFYGDGFLALENENLSFDSVNNSISLTFITRKENAIILLANDSEENSYSISLVDGLLEARIFNSESTQPVILKSKNKYSDNKMHCVTLMKVRDEMQLNVDDVTVDSDRAKIVDFKKKGRLYLGGYPNDINGMAGTSVKLDGCVSDVIANGVLLSMGDAKQYKLAKIGQCRYVDKASPVRPIDPPPPSDAAPPTACVQDIDPTYETDAKAVANAASFFAEITKVNPKLLNTNFIFEFDFRTFYENGLFGFLTNVDKTFFFGIQLHNGKLEIVYTHQGGLKRITFNENLNDGKWHSVRVNKAARQLNVISDSKTAKSDEIAETLDIALPLHMGGPMKPEEFVDNDIDLVSHSIRGCIRALSVNSFPINITDTQVVQDVGPCYKNVEFGAYFGGTAYGALAFSFKPSMTVSLDFKTTSQSGILFSMSDGKVFGFTLELHDGQVKLRVKNNRTFVAETTNENPFLYCDNMWHNVEAALVNNELSLFVDKGPVMKTRILDSLLSANANFMFVGGSKSNFKQVASLSNDMLNGCLRNLAIDGAPVDWYSFVDQQNVRKTGCPAF
ncbi:Laminin subunit alpha-2 [Bulinus truncatus]|nr:Laminin subunit alpha-2 [Bulinus truncatus]